MGRLRHDMSILRTSECEDDYSTSIPRCLPGGLHTRPIFGPAPCAAGQDRGRWLQSWRQSDELRAERDTLFYIPTAGARSRAICPLSARRHWRRTTGHPPPARACRRIRVPVAFAGFAGCHLGRDPLWLRRRYASDRPGCCPRHLRTAGWTRAGSRFADSRTAHPTRWASACRMAICSTR